MNKAPLPDQRAGVSLAPWKRLAKWFTGHGKEARHTQRKGRWDEVKLWQMGYKQELLRKLTFFNNAGCSFSVLSFFAVVESYSSQGLLYGGPVVIIWGWIVVSMLSLCVAACLAELVSAFPTSGGLYYWSWILAPPRWRAMSCWMTGWLNLLGQVAFTTSLEVSLAHFIATLISLHTTSSNDEPGHVLSDSAVMCIFAGLLVAHAVLNSINQQTVAACISFSTLWHIVAAAGFMVVLVCVAPTRQSNQFVWFEWLPNTDTTGIHSPVYIVLVGLLFSQWIIMGYDSCVHMCEETIDGDNAASWGVVVSVAGCSIFGLLFLLSLTYSLQSVDNLLADDMAAGGQPVAQLVWDVFTARYGSGRGAVPLLYIPAVGLFFCVFTSMTSNGRMIYAFSRDGAMLGARYWRQLNTYNRLPVAGTWLMALLSFLLGLPAIYVPQAFQTISATSVVALSLSYGIPIALRWHHGSLGFISGPFRLGGWSNVLAAIACTWIATVAIIFLLPTFYPVTAENMNYAPMALLLLLLLALFTWHAPGWGGKHWFTGPHPNVASTEMETAAQAPVGLKQDPSLPLDPDASVRTLFSEADVSRGKSKVVEGMRAGSHHVTFTNMELMMAATGDILDSEETLADHLLTSASVGLGMCKRSAGRRTPSPSPLATLVQRTRSETGPGNRDPEGSQQLQAALRQSQRSLGGSHRHTTTTLSHTSGGPLRGQFSRSQKSFRSHASSRFSLTMTTKSERDSNSRPLSTVECGERLSGRSLAPTSLGPEQVMLHLRTLSSIASEDIPGSCDSRSATQTKVFTNPLRHETVSATGTVSSTQSGVGGPAEGPVEHRPPYEPRLPPSTVRMGAVTPSDPGVRHGAHPSHAAQAHGRVWTAAAPPRPLSSGSGHVHAVESANASKGSDELSKVFSVFRNKQASIDLMGPFLGWRMSQSTARDSNPSSHTSKTTLPPQGRSLGAGSVGWSHSLMKAVSSKARAKSGEGSKSPGQEEVPMAVAVRAAMLAAATEGPIAGPRRAGASSGRPPLDPRPPWQGSVFYHSQVNAQWVANRGSTCSAIPDAREGVPGPPDTSQSAAVGSPTGKVQ